MMRRRTRHPKGEHNAQSDLVGPGRRGADRSRRRVHRPPVDAPEPEVTEEPDEELEDEPAQDDDPSTVQPAAFRDRIMTFIVETRAEQADRRRIAREAAYVIAGETEAERDARHRAEQKAAERAATAMWRQQNEERIRRLRIWLLLTAVSVGIGWELGLPQLLGRLPLPITVGAWATSAWFDWHMRGGGRIRVSEVEGPFRRIVLILVRVPVASAMVAVLHLVPALQPVLNHH